MPERDQTVGLVPILHLANPDDKACEWEPDNLHVEIAAPGRVSRRARDWAIWPSAVDIYTGNSAAFTSPHSATHQTTSPARWGGEVTVSGGGRPPHPSTSPCSRRLEVQGTGGGRGHQSCCSYNCQSPGLTAWVDQDWGWERGARAETTSEGWVAGFTSSPTILCLYTQEKDWEWGSARYPHQTTATSTAETMEVVLVPPGNIFIWLECGLPDPTFNTGRGRPCYLQVPIPPDCAVGGKRGEGDW